jgi:hypothetical protein
MVHDKCATYIEHVRKFNDRSCNKKRNSKLTPSIMRLMMWKICLYIKSSNIWSWNMKENLQKNKKITPWRRFLGVFIKFIQSFCSLSGCWLVKTYLSHHESHYWRFSRYRNENRNITLSEQFQNIIGKPC